MRRHDNHKFTPEEIATRPPAMTPDGRNNPTYEKWYRGTEHGKRKRKESQKKSLAKKQAAMAQFRVTKYADQPPYWPQDSRSMELPPEIEKTSHQETKDWIKEMVQAENSYISKTQALALENQIIQVRNTANSADMRSNANKNRFESLKSRISELESHVVRVDAFRDDQQIAYEKQMVSTLQNKIDKITSHIDEINIEITHLKQRLPSLTPSTSSKPNSPTKKSWIYRIFGARNE